MITLVYEYHHRTLAKLLRQRVASQNSNAKFSEEDTWSIAKDLILGLKSFRDVNLHHGDVQPGNIFVLDNKRLKLIDSCFLNECETGFERRLMDFEYCTPLSPEAMGGLLYAG